jgi:hypothetical protein
VATTTMPRPNMIITGKYCVAMWNGCPRGAQAPGGGQYGAYVKASVKSR